MSLAYSISNNFYLKLKNYYTSNNWTFKSWQFCKWPYSSCCFNAAQRCKSQRGKWKRCFNVFKRFSYQNWNRQRLFDVFQPCKFQCWCTKRHINLKIILTLQWNACWLSVLSQSATSARPKQVSMGVGARYWIFCSTEKQNYKHNVINPVFQNYLFL